MVASGLSIRPSSIGFVDGVEESKLGKFSYVSCSTIHRNLLLVVMLRLFIKLIVKISPSTLLGHLSEVANREVFEKMVQSKQIISICVILIENVDWYVEDDQNSKHNDKGLHSLQVKGSSIA